MRTLKPSLVPRPSYRPVFAVFKNRGGGLPLFYHDDTSVIVNSKHSYSPTHSPLWLCINLVTEGHDELPVLILVPGIGGLLCNWLQEEENKTPVFSDSPLFPPECYIVL